MEVLYLSVLVFLLVLVLVFILLIFILFLIPNLQCPENSGGCGQTSPDTGAGYDR